MIRMYLTVEEVVLIHDLLIEETGGASGIRDMGALESAVLRPRIGYYNNIIEEAAALMESLAINHPFVDGNKRIAFAAADTFLRMNGQFIDCNQRETYEFFMDLFETNSFRFTHVHSWLEENVKPIP